jgi:hypothetical protein
VCVLLLGLLRTQGLRIPWITRQANHHHEMDWMSVCPNTELSAFLLDVKGRRREP